MKPIIFNQRLTVFTNKYLGYSDTYGQQLRSKFTTAVEKIGMLQPSFALAIGPQQSTSPDQIPQNGPWFIIVHGIKVEFIANKIDIVSDTFITNKDAEIARLQELVGLLRKINEIISIGGITRMAYAPSFGLEGDKEKSVDDYWKSIIKISDLPDSSKQEKMLRYNTLTKINFDKYNDVEINRVITISEGQRKETNTTSNGDIVNSKTIECVIISIDINTSGMTGNYSIDAVDMFCKNAQDMGYELLKILKK